MNISTTKVSITLFLLIFLSSFIYSQSLQPWVYDQNNIYNNNPGNVGIGLTNPTEKLTLLGKMKIKYNYSSSGEDVLLIESNTGTGIYPIIKIGYSGGAPGGTGYLSIGNWNGDTKIMLNGAGSTWINPTGNVGISPTGNVLFAGSGNVGIGTSNPTQKLSVNGTIQAKEIIIETNWSDFVFNENYKLMDLTELKSYIDKNKHLPDIPSDLEVTNNGIQVGKIESKLLQKVEELTLYVIKLNKENQDLKKQLDDMQETRN